MRELAVFVMRGPRQAAIVAFVCTLIPMMFWLAAAIIGLVTLRGGLRQGAAVLVWAIIPALGWWLGLQDPGAVVVLLSTLVMAEVLRATVSWQLAFVVGALISVLVGILVPMMMPELIDTLVAMADQVFRDLAADAKLEYDDTVKASFRSMMIASFAASFYGMALGSLCLARSWQSKLYNPGGWKQEFHQLRLTPKTMLGFMAAMLVSPYIGVDATLLLLIVMLPITICGLALVHGVIGKKNLGGQWLFGFYVLVVILFPTVLMVVSMFAIVDSVFDFRGRMKGEGSQAD
jgi:hypothetical protein